MLIKILQKPHMITALILGIFLTFSTNIEAFSATKVTENQDTYTVSFPAGTLFKGILENSISTEICNTGDLFIITIPADIQIGDVNCIPKNSKLVGRIVRLGRAQAGRNGFMEVIIETLKFPDDQEVGMLAHIWTKDGTGNIGGEFTERSKYRKMKQSIEGIGDVAQLIPYGPRVMGKDTEALVGSEWIAVLDRELRLIIEKDY